MQTTLRTSCVLVLVCLARFVHSLLNSTGFCEKFILPTGFHCDEFTVQTRDFYLLTVQRIVADNNFEDSKGSKDTGNGICRRRSPGSVRSGRIGSVDPSGRGIGAFWGGRVESVNDSSADSAHGRVGWIGSVHGNRSDSGSRYRSRSVSMAADTISHVNGSTSSVNESRIGSEKLPVFLYHGIMQSGDIWVLDGPEASLAFMLAGQGYEVWIGNTRSSLFSHGHVIFSSSEKEFWDWDLDDLVDHDLPAMLKFVAKETGKKISFIGFSQGAMVGFASFINMEVSKLVEKAVMLSPVAYLSHIRSPIVRTAANLFLDQLDLLLGETRFSFSDELTSKVIYMACPTADSTCDDFDVLSEIEGPSGCSSNPVVYDAYRGSYTAVKNLAQLAQMMRSGKFSRYDYGPVGNLFHYWNIFSPSYSIGELPKTLPFLLVHGGNDYIAAAEDVWRLSSEIPGTLHVHFLPNYAHQDIIRGVCAHLDVYPRILEFLQAESNEVEM